MKIIMQKSENLKFSEISIGQIFMYNTSVYMKTMSMLDTSEDRTYNAIYLSNGESFFIGESEMIEPLEAELKVWR